MSTRDVVFVDQTSGDRFRAASFEWHAGLRYADRPHKIAGVPGIVLPRDRREHGIEPFGGRATLRTGLLDLDPVHIVVDTPAETEAKQASD